MRLLRRLVLAAGGLLAACGGSGGGPGSGLDASDYSGDYQSVRLSASGISSTWDAGGLCVLGSLRAFGDGTFTRMGGLFNENGAVDTALPVFGGPLPTYTVSASGQLVTTEDAVVQAGGLSSAGDVHALARTSAGHKPTIELGLRSDGTFSNASLGGTYGLFLLRYSSSGVDSISVGEMTCDGSGAFAFTAVTRNANGTVVAFPGPNPGTYTVQADGRVAVAVTGGNGWAGAVLAGGRLALLGGTTNAGGAPELLLLLRRDVGPTSNALFSGAYHVVGIRLDEPDFPGPPTPFTEVTALSGEGLADGAGTIQVDATENIEGAIFPSTGPTDYLVGANGALSFGDVAGALGGPFGRGAITSDGRFAAVGAVVNGESPFLFFFFRK